MIYRYSADFIDSVWCRGKVFCLLTEISNCQQRRSLIPVVYWKLADIDDCRRPFLEKYYYDGNDATVTLCFNVKMRIENGNYQKKAALRRYGYKHMIGRHSVLSTLLNTRSVIMSDFAENHVQHRALNFDKRTRKLRH